MPRWKCPGGNDWGGENLPGGKCRGGGGMPKNRKNVYQSFLTLFHFGVRGQGSAVNLSLYCRPFQTERGADPAESRRSASQRAQVQTPDVLQPGERRPPVREAGAGGLRDRGWAAPQRQQLLAQAATPCSHRQPVQLHSQEKQNRLVVLSNGNCPFWSVCF